MHTLYLIFGISAFSGSQKPKSLWSLVKAILGMKVDEDSFMTVRERIDFVIIMITFGCMVGQYVSLRLLCVKDRIDPLL